MRMRDKINQIFFQIKTQESILNKIEHHLSLTGLPGIIYVKNTPSPPPPLNHFNT